MIPERESEGFGKYLSDLNAGKTFFKYYDKAVEHAEDMGVHIEGHKPEKLLRITRPNETEEVKKYRLNIWEPVTEGLSDKVLNTLNRIYNPKGFDIKPKEGKDSEELMNYLNGGIPEYSTLMRFITESFTKKNLSDPNGCVAIKPESFEIPPTEAFQPVPIFYPSENLVDFEDGKYYTFVFKKEKDVSAIVIYTEISIEVYKPIQGDAGKFSKVIYEHEIGSPPVFRMGGLIKGMKAPHYFDSYVAGILPHWNTVVRLTSDLDANYISHIHMERWSYVSECNECEGSGEIEYELAPGELDKKSCPKCKGSGHSNKSPYGEWKIAREALNPDEPLPTPPAGFIAKDIGIVTKIEERIKNEEMMGYSSINMEIITKVGENQSGVAKSIDRTDLDGFLLAYSQHTFNHIIPDIILYMSWWIFGPRYDWNETKIKDIQPEIVAPKEFNVVSLDFLLEEYKTASTANVSDNYLIQIEKDIINKKFAAKEETRKRNIAIAELQPFPGRSDQDLLTLLNIGTEEWEIYKSTHIIELVDQAIADNVDFLNLSVVEQKAIIDELAQQARPKVNVIPNEPD